jgi:hypothetical protein
MKFVNLYSCVIITVMIVSCSVTKPRLSDSGGNYNSISDDMLLAKSSTIAIKSLVAKLEKDKKVLIVQVVDNDINDYLVDRVYEEARLTGIVAGKTNQQDLKTIETKMFDHFLMVYPIIYGTETAVTKPSALTKAVGAITSAFFGLGQYLMMNYEYLERQSGIVLHGRLVDAKDGQILWVEDFLQVDKMKLKGGLLDNVSIPVSQ